MLKTLTVTQKSDCQSHFAKCEGFKKKKKKFLCSVSLEKESGHIYLGNSLQAP